MAVDKYYKSDMISSIKDIFVSTYQSQSGTNEKQMQAQTHVDIIKEWSESSVYFYYRVV